MVNIKLDKIFNFCFCCCLFFVFIVLIFRVGSGEFLIVGTDKNPVDFTNAFYRLKDLLIKYSNRVSSLPNFVSILNTLKQSLNNYINFLYSDSSFFDKIIEGATIIFDFFMLPFKLLGTIFVYLFNVLLTFINFILELFNLDFEINYLGVFYA